MSKTIIQYELSITFDTPIVTQAIGTLAFGLDTAMQKDSNGNPVLSGSLIRGNIRHALQEFQQLTHKPKQITHWFGGEITEGEHQRAAVTFDFFWKLKEKDHSKITPQQRTRISIDNTGKVTEGALQIIEDCFPLGTGDVTFTGKIVAYLAPNEHAELEKWLRKAMDYIPALGSFKGIGFGRIKKYELTKTASQPPLTSPPLVLDTSSRFSIQLTLDNPFCLGRPKTPDSNRIVSSKHIKGNVIKALIACHYDNDSQALQQELCFDQLIISHALPTEKGQQRQSQSLALSYALLNDKAIDFATTAITELTWDEVPAFAPDWKPKDTATIHKAAAFNPIKLERYLSVKTGIDPSSGTSKEAELFSIETIVPSDNITWNATVELCNIPAEQRQSVANKLQDIFNQGLYGIGKTKANARVECLASHPPETLEITPDKQLIIDLVTAAKMLPAGLQISPINAAENLKAEYQRYWHQVHPDIQLLDYFAQQTLSSCYYHYTDNYQPDYLTTAGSVFILKLPSDGAKQAIQHCLQAGLPCYDIARDDSGDSEAWQRTPYLPEHGYGEISLHRSLVTGSTT